MVLPYRLISLLLIASALATTIRPSGVTAAPTNDTTHLTIKLADQAVSVPQTSRLELARTLRSARRVSHTPPRRYASAGHSRLAGDLRTWRTLEVPRTEALRTMTELRRNPLVAEVREEHEYRTAVTPNDPLLSQQYSLADNALSAIGAPSAWTKTTGSTSTVIAVIDGGIDLAHEDLRDKIWVNSDETAGNGIDDDHNGFVDDVHGWDFVSNQPAATPHDHGTHVAGIAAATSNNGVGVTGLNWQARVMSVRVLSSGGVGREEWIARGIEYAAANGASVINLSIVGPPSNVLLAAIENAYAAGATVVAAVGNNRSDTSSRPVYPACATINGTDLVLGVAATDNQGKPASFSSYGACADIAAPGSSIISTTTKNRYRSMSGTSMSAPLAAGAASLYLALQPGASPAQVISALKESQDPFTGTSAASWNQKYKGRLNVARLLGAPVLTSPPPTSAPTPSTSPAPTPLTGKPVLKVQLTAPATVTPGSTLTYQFALTNDGTSTGNGVTLTSRFDRGLVLSATSSSPNCVIEEGQPVCRFTEVSPGQTLSGNLTFNVAADERCSSNLLGYVTANLTESGRLRRHDRSDWLSTKVMCE